MGIELDVLVGHSEHDASHALPQGLQAGAY